MKRSTQWVSVSVLLVVGGLFSYRLVAPATTESAPAVVEVALGLDSSTPGTLTYLPLTLSGAPDHEVGRVISAISFPRSILSFVEVKRGSAADEVEAVVDAKAKESSGELAIVEVAISARQGIRPGTLATLTFKISADAKGGSVKLVHRVKVFTVSGERPVPAKGLEGEVVVIDTPVHLLGCFFYMH